MSNGRSFGRRQKRRRAAAPSDGRIVYGSTCTWWDSIDKVRKTGAGLPCCPQCGGVLFEMDNEAAWWASIDRYEREKRGARRYGYRAMMVWARGRCFVDFAALTAAYEETLA